MLLALLRCYTSIYDGFISTIFTHKNELRTFVETCHELAIRIYGLLLAKFAKVPRLDTNYKIKVESLKWCKTLYS